MKVSTCFLLIKIFAYSNSISRVRQKGDHRRVHLLQKTVPEYINEEYSEDTSNLDDVHNLKATDTIRSNRNMKLAFRAPRVETLTDFIQEAVKILNSYEDTAFKNFFRILDNEIRKYHYKGCKFSELTQNSDTRRLLAGSLKLIRGKPVSFTKTNINEVADMMRDETYGKNVKELLDYINSLYTYTEPNFHNILNELKYFRKTKSVKTHNDLVQVVRGGVRAILFDHYTELNTNTRRDLKERIETFWKQLKKYPASSAEMNDIPYTDPVIKSVVKGIKALKNSKPYYKNDPQMKLKNISERIVSIETDNEQFHDDNPEVNESGNVFWKPARDYAADDISSDQSFDNNKYSQERHEESNTHRYMTLYTEEISYKADTTKKTKIVPISTSVMTRRPKAKKQSTTTSTPRERHISSNETKKIEMLTANHDASDTKQDISDSSHDTEIGMTLKSKYKPRAKENYDKQRKHGKADKSKSKSKHKNAQIIRQYDAVIDVQLTNTDLLKYLGKFEPHVMDKKYDMPLYQKSPIQSETLPIKPKIRSGSVRSAAQIIPQEPITLSKPPTRYAKSFKIFHRKQFDESKRSIVTHVGHSDKQYKKDQNQKQKFIKRRSNNDTIEVKDFNKYIIKRIDDMEKEINELKEINDNNTNGVKVSNVTDKYEAKDNYGSKRKMKGNIIERFQNENHDINNETVNDGNTTKSNTMNTESTINNTTSSEPIVVKNDAVNATIIDNKNTSEATTKNVNVTNNTKEINEEVINNNALSTVTSVTNTTELESVVTTPTVPMTSTMAYSEPSFNDWPVPPEGKGKGYLDPFDLKRDGFFAHKLN